MIAAARPETDARQVADWLRVFVAPGQVTELRALECRERGYGWSKEGTVAGFFDDMDAMAECALELTRTAKGVYFVPNPLDPDLLARRYNRVAASEKSQLAHDCHVARRRWALVDCDPRRLAGISATDAEKAAAKGVARAVTEALRAEGWPRPVVADSGNGWHLVYPIDEPADDGGLVERTLKRLAARFGTAEVSIDPSVFNPARIVKLYGTVSRKGDDVPWRPHRRSAVLFVPPELRPLAAAEVA